MSSSDIQSPPLRPFDQRFHTRLQSPAYSLRSSSPSPSLPRSKISSISISADDAFDRLPSDNKLPWEVVRWSKLRKLSSQVYSESSKQQFGSPTCMAATSLIAVGTTKGYALIFDYNQTLICAIGSNLNMSEAGAVTAIAFSADHTYVATGHEHGYINVWHVKRPLAPRFSVPPIDGPKSNKDGHMPDAKILHIGFMAKRHSIVASADNRGMAFYHVSTRQLVQKSVHSIRIMGRSPNSKFSKASSHRQKKATSVLAFAPIPASGQSHPTEARGLIALMTPHILVIISTNPTAQTQYKATRPKNVADILGLTGCLDWLGALQTKDPYSEKSHAMHNSNPQLAYCWSNVLTILEVGIAQPDKKEGSGSGNSNTIHHLMFTQTKQFVADEAIVSVRWLNSQIIVLVTITQRLLVVNECSMKVTESVDLVPRQIMHHDYFSDQLNDLVITAGDGGDHYATIPDAFFNSFKTFKGRIFLLGSYEFAVGHLSGWTERLVALMEAEKFVDAIKLVTKYYTGETDQITIGLPEQDDVRHALILNRLVDMVLQALQYSLSDSGSTTPTTPVNTSALDGNNESDEDSHYIAIAELADACFEALYAADALDVLFDSVYECFEEANLRGIYFEALEPYILTERIVSLPPIIVKELINIYASLALNERLEEMICHMDTSNIDIDQVTTLCRQFKLYDALIYVWNQSLDDFIAPMADFVAMISSYFSAVKDEDASEDDKLDFDVLRQNISKVYVYLSYIFTGRIYPTGQYFDDEYQSTAAKAALYYFLFLGTTIKWPRQDGTIIHTVSETEVEPSFPYLRLLLKYDAPALVATMNEAFEDMFFNDSGEDELDFDDTDDMIFGRSINRQYIINILLELLGSDFSSRETIYLDMFIARNIAKYPQFIQLDDDLMKSVLNRLCDPPSAEISDDCQLSVEYLLSVYKPKNTEDLIDTFIQVRYYRVLKWIFRTSKDYARLIEVYFADDTSGSIKTYGSRDEVFVTIEECLIPSGGLTEVQVAEVRGAVSKCFKQLVETDPIRSATLFDVYYPELHSLVYDRLKDNRELQFKYLKTLFTKELSKESNSRGAISRRNRSKWNTQQARETYISLLCEFERGKVIQFLRFLQKGDVRLSKVLSSLESAGVIDGEIFLLRSEGQYSEAIRRLIQHLHYLKSQLLTLFPEDTRGRRMARGRWVHIDEHELADVEKSLQHYVILGTRLCTERVKKGQDTNLNTHDDSSSKLTDAESLWIELIDSIVGLTREVSSTLFPDITVFEKMSHSSQYDSPTKTLLFLRRLVQDVFSSLLIATSSSNKQSIMNNKSFLKILEEFLDRTAAASHSVVDLRSVLANIFEAYIYEKQLLTLTNRLLSKDLMVHVQKVYHLRQEGWRVSNPSCEICGKRIWGQGAPSGIYNAWERKRRTTEKYEEERYRNRFPVPVSTSNAEDDRSNEEFRGRRGINSRRKTGSGSRPSDSRAILMDHSDQEISSDIEEDDSPNDSVISNSIISEVETGTNNVVSSSHSSNSSSNPGQQSNHPARTVFLKPGEDYSDYDDSFPREGETATNVDQFVDDTAQISGGSESVGLSQGHRRLGSDNGTTTASATNASVLAAASTSINSNIMKEVRVRSQSDIDSLVVFRCKHIYHRKCLEQMLDSGKGKVSLVNDRGVGEGYRCILCL
ncbi:Golgi CORVET complex core vacuolar protein 8-domain-containing protein [Dipodascopsis uninucleata]